MLTRGQIQQLIADFAHSASLAREAGYDGIELDGLGRVFTESVFMLGTP